LIEHFDSRAICIAIPVGGSRCETQYPPVSPQGAQRARTRRVCGLGSARGCILPLEPAHASRSLVRSHADRPPPRTCRREAYRYAGPKLSPPVGRAGSRIVRRSPDVGEPLVVARLDGKHALNYSFLRHGLPRATSSALDETAATIRITLVTHLTF
jgi:hypothetical protein